MPVRIGEREYTFWLDTGASFCAFDIIFTNLMGKPLQKGDMLTAGGLMASELFSPPEAFLAKLDLRTGGPVICVDLEGIRRATGRDIRGVLGMEFLKNYVVRIDFDSGKVQFRSWDGRDHPEWGAAVHLYQAEEDRGVPSTKARLPGVGNITLIVDSGCNGAVGLVTEVFGRATDKVATSGGFTATAAGTRETRLGRLGSLALGGFDHHGLLVHEAIGNQIGLGLLSRHVVTFDFAGMKMYLQKGQAFGKPDESDMSGLHLWCIEGRILVHSVDKDSRAQTAGIRAEDVVLKVGDLSASATNLDDLRDLLKSGDGKEIQMTIKRGDEEKVVTFKLKKRI